MRTWSKARAGIVAGVVAASMGLGGCGDLTATQGPIANSADAPHLTRAQLVPAMTEAMKAAGSLHLELRATKAGKKTSVEADTSMKPGGSARFSLRDGIGLYGRPSDRTFELRLVGNSMFIPVPGKRGKFFQADTSDPSTLCGCLASQLRHAASPAGSVANLRRALVGLEFLGLEARDGLYLQHYRAELDPKRVLGAKRAQREKVTDVLTYELWLDSDHLIRRMTGEVLGIKVDAQYSDWGKRIDVDPPGPKQIVNAPRA